MELFLDRYYRFLPLHLSDRRERRLAMYFVVAGIRSSILVAKPRHLLDVATPTSPLSALVPGLYFVLVLFARRYRSFPLGKGEPPYAYES